MAGNARKRNLALLGGATLVVVAIAVVSVFRQSSELAPQFQPHPVFPDLQANINTLTEITVASKSGAFHVRLMGGKWVIVEKDSFPADAQTVRSTAQGMASLEAVDQKTDQPNLLGVLGLDAPSKGGDGVEIALTGTGKLMADLLVGHSEGSADDLGRTLVYVRKPNENQAWLARGYLQPKATIGDWLDKNVFTLAQDRIKGASMTPEMGPSYSLSRDTKDQPDFKLLDMPKGRELAFDGSPDGVASAMANFTFDDVTKAGGIDFAKAAQLVTYTFDGLTITTKIAMKGADPKAMNYWVTIMAMGTSDKTEKEATDINAKTEGWAFKLPELAVAKFTATRESLLKPPDTGKTTAAAKPAAAAH